MPVFMFLAGLVGVVLAIKLTLLWQFVVVLVITLILRTRQSDMEGLAGLVYMIPVVCGAIGMIAGNIYFFAVYGDKSHYSIPAMINWLFTP